MKKSLPHLQRNNYMNSTYNASLPERTAIVAIVLASLATIIYACMTTEVPSSILATVLILLYAFSRITLRFAHAIEARMLANSRVKPLTMWPKIIMLALVTACTFMVMPEKELLLLCLPSVWAAMAIHLKQDVFQD